jgi:hypothetical protein
MVLDIFHHGRLSWEEEEEEEGEGEEFNEDHCRTGSTPFGDLVEHQLFWETFWVLGSIYGKMIGML